MANLLLREVLYWEMFTAVTIPDRQRALNQTSYLSPTVMSLRSASSLIGLQVFSRGGTFALNQALVRLASPTAFGAAAIQFELVLSTILFLSREGVRTALLRAPPPVNAAPTSAAARRANTAFIPVIVGVPLALATALLYVRIASAEVHAQPHFLLAVALYALAAVLELLSEPLYNMCVPYGATSQPH